MDWGRLVAETLHPTKVAIIEALLWIDEPFSAKDLEQMSNGTLDIPAAAYHLRYLASELNLLRVYKEEEIRGTTRKLYFFPGRTPASKRRKPAA